MHRKLVLWTALCAAVLSPLMAAVPASITAVNPNQTAAAGGSVTLYARVLDASSLPVAYQPVTFTAAIGGSFVNPTVFTDASGLAAAIYTAPASTGTYYAYATVVGYGMSAGFSITVGAGGTGTAASILAVNPTQTVAPGASATLYARVLDAGSVPLAYQWVTFTAPMGGSFTSPSVYTDASGLATAIYSAPSTTGTYYVYATVGALTATFYITVSTTGTTPGTAVGMQVYSGNGQVVTQTNLTAMRPLTVVIRDSSGTPVPYAPVFWQVTTGTATLASSYSYTDTLGLASVSVTGSGAVLGLTYQQAVISASSGYGTVSFWLTSLATNVTGYAQILTPSSGTRITGKAGQTVPAAIRAIAYAYTTTGMVPISYAGLDVTADTSSGPTARCSTGGTVLTDASGTAQCDLVMGKTTGDGTLAVNVASLFYQTIDFTVTAGDPASITVIQGDGQTGRPGETLPQALVAEIRDAGGTVLQGLPVLWEFGTEGTGARLNGASSATDSAGRVSATLTLGPRPGTVVVRVKPSSNTAIVATFTLKAALPVAGLVKISGDSQTGVTGQAFGAALVVEVRDSSALPLANVTVTFAVTTGSATLSSATAVSDSQGRASVTVQAGSTAGSITVSATADSQSVVFSLTARLPGPALTAASFLNGASYKPGLVPGGVTAIVAAGLATGINGCMGPGTVLGPLPTKVADVQVMFGGTLAPIYAVCNVSGQEQVIVQAPWEMAPGYGVMVKVTVGVGSTVVERVPVLAAMPGIFETTGADGKRYAVALGADGILISAARRARRGDLLYFYGTGLGTVLPLGVTNQPGFPGQKVWFPVVVGVGGKGVRVVSAELAANMIGVYEIAIEIPADSAWGDDVALDLAIQTVEGQTPVFAATSKISIGP
jgi:uncharacterized protein (TIGR03437 family)